MNIFSVITLCILLMSVFTNTLTASASWDIHLSNFDFELWAKDGNDIESWCKLAPAKGGYVSRETQDVKQGKFSLRLNSPYCAVEQIVKLEPDTEYELEAWIKSDFPCGVTFKTEQNLGNADMTVLKKDQWQKVSFRFNSQLEKQCRIIILFRAEKGHYALFDAVKLRQFSPVGGAKSMVGRRIALSYPFYHSFISSAASPKDDWLNEYKASAAEWHDKKIADWNPGDFIRVKINDSRMIVTHKNRYWKQEFSFAEFSVTEKSDKDVWLQIIVRMHDFWSVLPEGAMEGKPWLIEYPRTMAIRLLLENGDIDKIKRYILKIDREQSLEFTLSGKAALPNSSALKELLSGIELKKVENPFLKREFDLLASGNNASTINFNPIKKIELPPYPLTGVSRVYVAPGLDFSDDYKRGKLELFELSGFNSINYLDGDSSREWLLSRPVFTTLQNKYKSDLWDKFRPNISRGHVLLDEPYERQLDYNEVISQETLIGKNMAQAMELYLANVRKMVNDGRLWNADKVMIFEGHEYIAWNDFSAGCDYFILENVGNRDWYHVFPELKEMLTNDQMYQWRYMMVKASADYFGGKWGSSIYDIMPREDRLRSWEIAYEMGADFLEIWQEKENSQWGTMEILDLGRAFANFKEKHPRKTTSKTPDVLIIVPEGWVPQRYPTLWGGIDIGKDYHRSLMLKLFDVTIPLLKSGKSYLICNQEKMVDKQKFKQVIRLILP